MRIQKLIVIIIMLGLVASSAHATTHTDLPEAAWYAVVWNRSTDTLHWVNSVGEQASRPRPQLPDEGVFGVALYISPDGRYLIQHGRQNGGQDAISFFDLQSGQTIQTHIAQPGEVIVPAERNPFTWNSQYVAFGLTDGDNWRVISFETETGNVHGLLTNAHPGIPAEYVPAGSLPSVALYDLDEGAGQFRVHVRFMSNGFVPDNVVFNTPGLAWLPQMNIVHTDTLSANIGTFDAMHPSGRMVYAVRDAQNPGATSVIYQSMMGHFDTPTTVFNTQNALAYSPRWVAGDLMIAYRIAQQPFATMWHLVPAVGGEPTPFAPDYEELYGTIDGFILLDTDENEMKFSNTLQFAPYSPSVGNTIFNAPGQNISIVYVTPIGATFSLTNISGTHSDSPLVGGVDVAPPVQPTTASGIEVAPPPAQPTTAPGIVVAPPPAQPTTAPGIVVAPPVQPTATTGANIAAPIGDGNCSLAVSQQVSVGMPNVRVNQLGGTLALRTNVTDPYPSHQVPGGANIDIVSGPVCHEGHRLWRINVNINGQNVNGYVSEGINGTRYISQS